MKRSCYDLSPETLYELLKMRVEGVGYVDIGNRFSLSAYQVSIIITRLKEHINVHKYDTIKLVADYAGLSKNQIVDMIRHKYENQTSGVTRKIKINESISNKNLWYNSYKGKEFEAKRKMSYYYVTEFLKVRGKDCIELPQQ